METLDIFIFFYFVKLIFNLYYRWRPVLTVFDILLSVISMLLDPNTDSPANIDASVLYYYTQ